MRANPPGVRGKPRFGILVVRPWYAVRRAVGWHQATRRQRFTVLLGGLCALSVVAGAAVAAAGVGQPGPPVPGLDRPQLVAANQAQTAAWIAQQVSPGTVVSCDPAMCNQLREKGFPAAQLTVLPPASARCSPVWSSRLRRYGTSSVPGSLAPRRW